MFAMRSRAALIGREEIGAHCVQSLLDLCVVKRDLQRRIQLFNDGCGRSFGSIDTVPNGNIHLWYAKLTRSRNIGEVLVTLWRRRSEEHTSELQSLMRISYAVFCLKKKNNHKTLQ